MTRFEELNVDPEDNEEKLAAFRQFSRKLLYMVLFQNDALQFSVFQEEPLAATANPGPETDSTEKQQQILKAFGHYLHSQMLTEFNDPEQFSIDEWAELAQQMHAKPKNQQDDLRALSTKIYRLLKQELTLERERQIRSNPW